MAERKTKTEVEKSVRKENKQGGIIGKHNDC